MKCTNCGFTYEDEFVCPICGAPAPYYEASPAALRYEQPQTSAPAAAYVPAHAKTKEAPPKPAPPAFPKGLLIATLCVLSVIAAALVANAFLQSIGLMRGARAEQQGSDGWDEYSVDSDLIPDNGYTAPQYFDDGAVHKIGEVYSFEEGALCLKNAKLTGAASALDSSVKQAAFTVVFTNTSQRTQSFFWPDFAFADDAFDEQHYLYSETNQGNKEFFTLAAGKSLTAVFYYNLPKDNQKLTCTVRAYGFFGDTTADADNGDFTAAATYEFETKNIK